MGLFFGTIYLSLRHPRKFIAITIGVFDQFLSKIPGIQRIGPFFIECRVAIVDTEIILNYPQHIF